MAFGVQYGQPPLPPEDEVEAAWDTNARIGVLIGTTADETSFFAPGIPPIRLLTQVPLIGQNLGAAITRFTTQAVYGRSAEEFARRHARAGGTAYRYLITWSAPGNRFAARTLWISPLYLARRPPGVTPQQCSPARPGNRSTEMDTCRTGFLGRLCRRRSHAHHHDPWFVTVHGA